jgi:hypothetical protein
VHLPTNSNKSISLYGRGVYNIAIAISHAEGAWVPGSLPNRHNNPGDLMAGGQVRAFRTVEQGWYELMDFIFTWFAGFNADITPALTWEQLGAVYVNGPNAPATAAPPENWVKTVTDYLGVKPTETLQAYLTV